MGLNHYRFKQKSKLLKLETSLKSEAVREKNRRIQNIRRPVRVMPNGLNLLASLLNSKQEQIVMYLNVIKDLEL